MQGAQFSGVHRVTFDVYWGTLDEYGVCSLGYPRYKRRHPGSAKGTPDVHGLPRMCMRVPQMCTVILQICLGEPQMCIGVPQMHGCIFRQFDPYFS